jgi:hypothetical protein
VLRLWSLSSCCSLLLLLARMVFDHLPRSCVLASGCCTHRRLLAFLLSANSPSCYRSGWCLIYSIKLKSVRRSNSSCDIILLS